VRYLVETGTESFPLEAPQPLEEGQSFIHERKVYIARFFEPGRNDFDGVVKADFAGEVGPAGPG